MICTRTHTGDQFTVPSAPHPCVTGLWEETGEPGENMQTASRKGIKAVTFFLLWGDSADRLMPSTSIWINVFTSPPFSVFRFHPWLLCRRLPLFIHAWMQSKSALDWQSPAEMLSFYSWYCIHWNVTKRWFQELCVFLTTAWLDLNTDRCLYCTALLMWCVKINSLSLNQYTQFDVWKVALAIQGKEFHDSRSSTTETTNIYSYKTWVKGVLNFTVCLDPAIRMIYIYTMRYKGN